MKLLPAAVLLIIACAPPAKLTREGDPCASDAECGGLTCLVVRGECPGSCVERPRAGEKCGVDTAPCEAGLACIGGRCAKAKALGEACEPGLEECAAPDFCDGVSGVCVAPGGEADRCGYLPVDGAHDFNSCASGLECTVDDASADGVCVVPAEVGEICGPTKPCRVGFCDGVCEPPRASGASCASDAECESACIDHRCVAACAR